MNIALRAVSAYVISLIIVFLIFALNYSFNGGAGFADIIFLPFILFEKLLIYPPLLTLPIYFILKRMS